MFLQIQPFYFIPALLLVMAVLSAGVCLAYRRLEPLSLSGRVAKAGRLMSSGKSADAIPLLEQTIDTFAPEQADLCDIYFMLGSAHMAQGEFTQAAAQYDGAISLSLGNLDYDYSREFTKIYEAYLKTGQRDKAEKLCRYLLLSNADTPLAEEIRRDAEACGLHPEALAGEQN